MESMFYNFGRNSGIISLDLGGFDTSNVTNMDSMFNGAKIQTIYVSSKWNTNKVTSSSNMFSGCTNLVGALGTVYNASFIDKTYARVDGGVSQPGYLTLVPVGYKMLNYIQSTGTQYIDTGYSSDEGFKWDMLFEYTDEIISRYIIGSHGEFEPYGRNGFRYETTGSYWQLGLGNGYPTYSMSISLNTKYRINGSTIKGNNYVNLNGNRIITSANAEERSANSVMLLNNQYGLKLYDTSVKGRIYFVKIYDGADNLVRNLSPCINSSGEVGLYDFVNNQFYGNSGTGTFKT
jgi:surface protein